MCVPRPSHHNKINKYQTFQPPHLDISSRYTQFHVCWPLVVAFNMITCQSQYCIRVSILCVYCTLFDTLAEVRLRKELKCHEVILNVTLLYQFTLYSTYSTYIHVLHVIEWSVYNQAIVGNGCRTRPACYKYWCDTNRQRVTSSSILRWSITEYNHRGRDIRSSL